MLRAVRQWVVGAMDGGGGSAEGRSAAAGRCPPLPAALDFPDEGERTVTISRALASRCAVGQAVAELQDEDEGASREGSVGGIAVPAVPGSVPSEGLRTVDEWAQAAERHGGTSGTWISDFLNGHREQLPAALVAADFLQCPGFLSVGADAMLLFLAAGGEAAIASMAAGSSPSLKERLSVRAAGARGAGQLSSAASGG